MWREPPDAQTSDAARLIIQNGGDMSAGIWFWIIYVIVGLFGGIWGFRSVEDRRWLGGGLIIYILIGLLGWGVFGAPLR